MGYELVGSKRHERNGLCGGETAKARSIGGQCEGQIYGGQCEGQMYPVGTLKGPIKCE